MDSSAGGPTLRVKNIAGVQLAAGTGRGIRRRSRLVSPWRRRSENTKGGNSTVLARVENTKGRSGVDRLRLSLWVDTPDERKGKHDLERSFCDAVSPDS